MPQAVVDACIGSPSGSRVEDLVADAALCDSIRNHIIGCVGECQEPCVETAQALADHIRRRLKIHLIDRASDSSVAGHWCWQWFALNINRIALMVQMSGHVRADVANASMEDCLHSLRKNFMPFSDIVAGFNGGYKHSNRHTDEAVRSGKSFSVEGFGGRMKEHLRCAKANIPSTKFYARYPSKEGPGVPPPRGTYYEDLHVDITLAFDRRDKDAVTALTSAAQSGSLFDWSPNEFPLHSAGIPGATTIQDKRLAMVAYSWELYYDLMIARRNNASGMPGFECLNAAYKIFTA